MLPALLMIMYKNKVGDGQMVQPTAGQNGGNILNLKQMRILSEFLGRGETEGGVKPEILYLLLTVDSLDHTGTYVKWVCLVLFYFSGSLVNPKTHST